MMSLSNAVLTCKHVESSAEFTDDIVGIIARYSSIQVFFGIVQNWSFWKA